MGTILDDVVIITPQANVTATLRVKPAYQSYLPEIICSPVINEDHAVAFHGKIEKNVTGTAGRAEYQVILTDQNGKAVASYAGSFNVSRGIMVDMPEDAEELENYSLEQIYTMLSNVTTVYNMLVNVENVIGMPNEELETISKNIIGAINELNSTVKTHEETIASHGETIESHGKEINRQKQIIGDENSGLVKQANRNTSRIEDLEELTEEHERRLNTPIKTEQLEDEVITHEKLSSDAVKTRNIAERAVTEGKIGEKAVSNSKLSPRSVTEDKLSTPLAERLIKLENEAISSVKYDAESGTLTFTSLNGIEEKIDLPLELIVSNGRYDEESQDIVLVLANGNEINIPLDDLNKTVIEYIDGVRDSIYVLQKAPPLDSLVDAVLLPTPTLSAIAGIN
jgi:hypothetical protein